MYDAERIIFSIQYDMHTGCLHPLNDKIKLPMRHVEFMKGIFMDNITIRTAKPSDADKLLEIYAPYVEKTAITFEYEVPHNGEFYIIIQPESNQGIYGEGFKIKINID